MAYHLSGIKPLTEPMLAFCSLDSEIQQNFNKNAPFNKMHLKMLSAKWQLFCLSLNDLAV